MAYKDLLVVLDANPRSAVRLSLAAGFAEEFGAHLVGLYVKAGPDPEDRFGYYDVSLFDPMFRADAQADSDGAEKTRVLFEDTVKRHALSAEWRSVAGYPSENAALHGRYADLIVLGQIDPDEPGAPLKRARPEDVTLMAGRPVLVVPYAGNFERVGRRVLIGWDASREAIRAVSDAMPLLRRADTVTVLTIDAEQTRIGHGEVPGADIALHLARHGVTAQIEHAVSAGIGGGNTLLSRASDLSADLLVMGAYGHSRMRELMLGGTTKTVLESMTIPVLMAH